VKERRRSYFSKEPASENRGANNRDVQRRWQGEAISRTNRFMEWGGVMLYRNGLRKVEKGERGWGGHNWLKNAWDLGENQVVAPSREPRKKESVEVL